MQQFKRYKRSKLKLRPYGVMTVADGRFDKEQAYQGGKSRLHRKRKSSFISTFDSKSTFITLIKGLSLLVLLALFLRWANSLPSGYLAQKSIEQTSSEPQSVSDSQPQTDRAQNLDTSSDTQNTLADTSGNIAEEGKSQGTNPEGCLLYTSPSPRDRTRSRMPSSA